MPALSVDVLARFDDFSKALGSMAGDASKVAGELSRSFGGIARTFGLLGGVSIGAGSLAILKSTVTELAALNDGANRAGISVEQLSSRINTLSPTGVGLEQLLDLYAKLTKSALAADNATSRQAEAFRQLGVKTRDALGNMRNADELVDDVAKALSRFADDGNKAAYAQAFFEESGQRLLPILTDIASKQREAASVTKEQAQAADDLADKLGEVGRNVDVVRQRIVADLIPTLDQLGSMFATAARNSESFSQSLAVVGKVKARELIGENVLEQLESARDELARLTKFRDELVSANSTGAVGLLRNIIGESSDVKLANDGIATLKALIATLDDLAAAQFDAAFAGFADFRPDSRAGTQKPSAPALRGTGAKPTERFQAALTLEQEALIKAVKGYQDVEQAAALYAETLKTLDQLFFADAISAQQYDVALQSLTRTSEARGSGEEDRLRAEAQAWRDAIDPLSEFVRLLERVDRAQELNIVSPAEAARIKEWLAETRGSLEDVTEYAREAARNIQDFLGESLNDVLSGNFEDIGDAFGQMIKRMLVEAAAANLARVLIGDYAKTGSIGGILGGVGAALAGGGGASAKSAIPVALSSGRAPAAAGGGGVTVIQHNTIGDGVQRGEVITAMTAAKNEAIREMVDMQRRRIIQ